MFLARSADGWYWSEEAAPAVDFAVHALLVDGLHIPPFDQHPDGDRHLRDRGLEPDAWLAWIQALVTQHARLGPAARADDLGVDEIVREVGSILFGSPGALCPGPEALRLALADLWSAYSPVSEAWRIRTTSREASRRRRGAPSDERRLWKLLLPFHDQLPDLSVFLVSYPQPVVMPVPPTAALIAPASEAVGYGQQVLHAAELLLGGGGDTDGAFRICSVNNKIFPPAS